MTEKEAFGEVFRELRTSAKHTLQDVADGLQKAGLDVTSRAGVSRLEERGSTDLLIIRAYAQIYGKKPSQIEEMAQSKCIAVPA